MDIEFYQDEFKKERRARLAAERLLEQKQSQLKAANHKLSQHAIGLSGQIVDQRKTLVKLEGEHSKATELSLKANHKALAAERLLWDAVKSIQDGFAVFDKDRKLIAANAPYLGLFKASQNVGPGISLESILDLCLEEDLIDRNGRSEDEWYEFMLDRLSEDDIKPITLRLHNGVYVKVVDTHTADGGIVSLALNITDTINREKELLEARDAALTADRAKSAFLAKMSHEFRTPINGVVGMAEVLVEHSTDEETLLCANTIKTSSQAILDFVNNVLEYAMIEDDRLTLQVEPFGFQKVLDVVKQSISTQDLTPNVEVIFETDPRIPDQLLGDASRIGQVVGNLFSNAVQNTVSGFILVRTLWSENDGVSKLVIAVEDTGAGIPEDKLEHIFGGFNQTDDSLSRGKDGAGLGLSIVQKLVETMGGVLTIISIEGEGSHFEASIPMPSTDPSVSPPIKTPFDGTVLVVAENPLIHAALSRVLSFNQVDFDETVGVPSTKLDGVEIALVEAALSENFSRAMPDIRMVTVGSNDGICAPFKASTLLDALTSDPTPIEVITIPQDRKVRVLAAEDNTANQLVFQKMVKDLDIELMMVGNGEEAVEANKTFKPDLIFMDISMPKMDGMEATQQIRWSEVEDDTDSVIIIAMTAHAMEGDEARIRQCGLDHYLTKPLSKAGIIEMIEQNSPWANAPEQKVS